MSQCERIFLNFRASPLNEMHFSYFCVLFCCLGVGGGVGWGNNVNWICTPFFAVWGLGWGGVGQ